MRYIFLQSSEDTTIEEILKQLSDEGLFAASADLAIVSLNLIQQAHWPAARIVQQALEQVMEAIFKRAAGDDWRELKQQMERKD